MIAKHQLFTTGYSGFKGTDFVWKLRTYQIDVVVDVRDSATSRNRAFDKSNLKPLLEGEGIQYVHFQSLGVPPEIRRDLRNGGSRVRYFSRYREHLRNRQEALKELRKLVTEKRCCLLCLESKPEECHRSVLAETLVKRGGNGIEVEHI